MSIVTATANSELHAVRDLDAIAASVRSNFENGKAAYANALEASLAVGRDLAEARELLPSDQAFGSWFREQEFPFSRRWGWTLRTAAECEAEVRAAVGTQVLTGADPNIKKALATVRGGETSEPVVLGDLPEGVFRTIVADPPWRYDNTSTRGAAEDHYTTMSIEELCSPDFARRVENHSAEQSHLYLWTTNGFLREAFDVMEAWSYTYKTLLTWAKTQMGMGNYFRSSTEHVLFGVRGGLGTEDKATMNWFEAGRGRHSAKPDCFYDLVQRSSPGPYLEMFARSRRLGWSRWGLEA